MTKGKFHGSARNSATCGKLGLSYNGINCHHLLSIQAWFVMSRDQRLRMPHCSPWTRHYLEWKMTIPLSAECLVGPVVNREWRPWQNSSFWSHFVDWLSRLTDDLHDVQDVYFTQSVSVSTVWSSFYTTKCLQLWFTRDTSCYTCTYVLTDGLTEV